MPKLIASAALGAVLACSSPALAQDGVPCDPQYSLNMWIESAPDMQFHEFSESQTAALMEVIEAPALPLFANTVGAVLVLIESSPVGVVAFHTSGGVSSIAFMVTPPTFGDGSTMPQGEPADRPPTAQGAQRAGVIGLTVAQTSTKGKS